MALLRPGTGKTVTVVESIRQLLLRNSDSHILACAPSNSAADSLALKLADLGRDTIFRLNSTSREFKRLPETLQEFSLYNDNHVFANPTLEVMRKYKVIVSTCVSGGIPYALGIARGYFSHIFIDEAGQSMEPEIMIPIKTMADALTNVILAGDHKQLGPYIRSHLARDLGLKHSYLSRITAREIYDLQIGRGLTCVAPSTARTSS
jgi:helicase MOV-10